MLETNSLTGTWFVIMSIKLIFGRFLVRSLLEREFTGIQGERRICGLKLMKWTWSGLFGVKISYLVTWSSFAYISISHHFQKFITLFHENLVHPSHLWPFRRPLVLRSTMTTTKKNCSDLKTKCLFNLCEQQYKRWSDGRNTIVSYRKGGNSWGKWAETGSFSSRCCIVAIEDGVWPLCPIDLVVII